MTKKNRTKWHEHSEKTVTREAENTVLAKRWEESLGLLATAERLERQESAYALAQYKKDRNHPLTYGKKCFIDFDINKLSKFIKCLKLSNNFF